jgi:hypothetical protein
MTDDCRLTGRVLKLLGRCADTCTVPPENGLSPSYELRRLKEPASFERAHAVRLDGDAAMDLRDGLGRVTREGFALARRARPGDLYELVPNAALRRGLDNGALRVANSRHGDASVLVKDTTTGRIAGPQDLKKVKPKPGSLIGPAAWQAMAAATQQHYLVEIASKLDGLREGIEEVLARMDDDRIGELNHYSENAASALAARTRDGRLSDTRVAELQRDADAAKRLWHQVATTARRHVRDYREGARSAEEVERSLVMALHVLRVLAQCSEALLAAPYETAFGLDEALRREQDRLGPAMSSYAELFRELSKASSYWHHEQGRYRARRPRSPLKRGWNKVPLPGRFGPLKPAQLPLSLKSLGVLRAPTLVNDREVPSLLIEVQAGGSVLLAPPSD